MKILLPPSEWKLWWWVDGSTTITVDMPYSIAVSATEKDLKCTWKRYEEWITLNKSVNSWPIMKAIERYTWVMFSAIDFESMSEQWKEAFETTIGIISWMYWLVAPDDYIANYKLPIGTKWLKEFWKETITKQLQWEDIIIDLLPQAHKKVIDFAFLKDHWTRVIQCDFYSEWKKLAHWVKPVKGYRIRTLCEQWDRNIDHWPMEFIYKWKHITVWTSIQKES